jgi:hypothetical protein
MKMRKNDGYLPDARHPEGSYGSMIPAGLCWGGFVMRVMRAQQESESAAPAHSVAKWQKFRAMQMGNRLKKNKISIKKFGRKTQKICKKICGFEEFVYLCSPLFRHQRQ